MTESEWLVCSDPKLMLAVIGVTEDGGSVETAYHARFLVGGPSQSLRTKYGPPHSSSSWVCTIVQFRSVGTMKKSVLAKADRSGRVPSPWHSYAAVRGPCFVIE